MSGTGGLLGYLAPTPMPDRIAEAGRRAPWRGAVSASVLGPMGEVRALGAARAGRDGHVAVVLHGRIDNLDSLARDAGIADRAADPCAVLASVYLRHGDEFAGRVLGDYAALVLDERRGALLAVRDWIGTRPLFWGSHRGGVAFGSEVKQVLALLGRDYALNEAALAAYENLEDQPLDVTFADGILAVLPNGQALAAPGRPVRSWRRGLRFDPLDLSPDEAAARMRERLSVAVGRRTRDARFLGAMVSGGMDSTSIVASAASLAGRGQGPPLRLALTTAYPDAPDSDETAYGREVAQFWSIPWAPVVIRAAEFLTWPDEGFVHHDGPTFPAFRVFSRLATAAADAGVDVLLTGDGGDFWLRQEGRELDLCLLRGEWCEAARWARHDARQRSPAAVGKAIARTLARRFLKGARAEAVYEAGVAHASARLSLEAQEREAARHGVRVEFPFCDLELASLLVGLSPKRRSSPGLTKVVSREAMVGLLPEAIRTRRTWTTLDPVLLAALGADGRDPDLVLARVLVRRFADHWRHQHAIGGSAGQEPVPAIRSPGVVIRARQ